MIPSHKRLTGKDVGYMLRRGKKLYGEVFVCVVIDQYENRSRHQCSVQIPVKCDKRATKRNLLKRTAQALFWKNLEEKKIGEKYGYKKFFLFLNKKNMQKVIDLLATGSKTTIVKKRKEYCQKDFNTFFSSLGKKNL